MSNAFALIFSMLALTFSALPAPLGTTLTQFVNATLTRSSRHCIITTPVRVIPLINVPDILQSTNYTCGPTSLLAVLSYYSFPTTQQQISQAAQQVAGLGTGPKMLQKAFNKIVSNKSDLQLIVRENMTTDQLQESIKQGNPVIVLLNHAKSPNDTRSYRDYNDRGHYMVLVGFDSDIFFFEDPWVSNAIKYINKAQFVDMWHDHLTSQGRYVQRVGLIVRRKQGVPAIGRNVVGYFLE